MTLLSLGTGPLFNLTAVRANLRVMISNILPLSFFLSFLPSFFLFFIPPFFRLLSIALFSICINGHIQDKDSIWALGDQSQ